MIFAVGDLVQTPAGTGEVIGIAHREGDGWRWGAMHIDIGPYIVNVACSRYEGGRPVIDGVVIACHADDLGRVRADQPPPPRLSVPQIVALFRGCGWDREL